MSYKHKVRCSVSLILLTILAVLIPGSAIFAKKPEPTIGGKKTASPFSIVVAVIPPTQDSPEVNFSVDISEERKEGKFGYHYLAGWIYVNDQETRGQEVYVQLERPDGTVAHYSTMPIERPDVVNAFKNQLYYISGFRSKIPLKDELDIDVCTIRLVVKIKKGIFLSPGWKVGIRFSPRVELALPGPESLIVNFNVDANEERKEGNFSYHYLSGWIFVKDQDSKGQKVYVQFEKPDGTVVHYLTISMKRTDVGGGFNNPFYNYSGFSASIPLKDGLEINACTIRLVVKNKNGIFKSPEWKAWNRVSLSTGKITLFVAVNWLLVIITCLILIVTIWRDRSLLLKPSIMVVLFFHVMCQWGAAIDAGRIESALQQPWIFVLLSQGFPLIGLIVSLFTARGTARHLWGRITADNPVDPARKTWAWAILAVFFAGFIAIYLSHVPFRSTGLYTIFSSPLESGLARDMSVKFLDNAFLRYGHNIIMAVFAPLLAVLALQVMLVHWKRRNWFLVLFIIACLAVIVLASSISGARSYSAAIVMVVIFALLLRRGFPINPVHFIVVVLLILAFPTILTLLREGKAVTAKSFFDYFRISTYRRVVIIPMETGLMHVHYAQTHGFFGIQAIPKLAALKGIEPLNVPNFIAKMYTSDPQTTIWANTSYVYAYYSYFGLLAFIPCLIGLWLLDLSLLVYRRLSDNLLIPCVACIAINTSNFSSVEYTVSLFTFGFLFLLLVSWVVDRAVGRIVNR